jgi:hypothetical protein
MSTVLLLKPTSKAENGRKENRHARHFGHGCETIVQYMHMQFQSTNPNTIPPSQHTHPQLLTVGIRILNLNVETNSN